MGSAEQRRGRPTCRGWGEVSLRCWMFGHRWHYHSVIGNVIGTCGRCGEKLRGGAK